MYGKSFRFASGVRDQGDTSCPPATSSPGQPVLLGAAEIQSANMDIGGSLGYPAMVIEGVSLMTRWVGGAKPFS